MKKEDIARDIDMELGRFCTESIVMVAPVVSGFLSYAVSCKEVMDIISESAKMYQYDEVMGRSCIENGIDCRFVLPENKMEIISLVTGMLFAVDCGRIAIVDFVRRYFKGEDINEAYQDFCGRVIVPYRNALEFCLFDNDVKIEEPPAPASEPVYFPQNQVEEICYWVAEMENIIVGDNDIPDFKRKEFIILLNSLRYVAEQGNTVLLQAIWIGLKRTLGTYTLVNRELKHIYSILAGYGVIDTDE